MAGMLWQGVYTSSTPAGRVDGGAAPVLSADQCYRHVSRLRTTHCSLVKQPISCVMLACTLMYNYCHTTMELGTSQSNICPYNSQLGNTTHAQSQLIKVSYAP